jgi:hypothetical protein
LKEANLPGQKKMPGMTRALFEFGGPGRNRTTDTRISSNVAIYAQSVKVHTDFMLEL